MNRNRSSPIQHDVVFRVDVAEPDERSSFAVYRAMMKAAADLGVKAEVMFASSLASDFAFSRTCSCGTTMTIRAEQWGKKFGCPFDTSTWPPEIDALYRRAGWSADDRRWWWCGVCAKEPRA